MIADLIVLGGRVHTMDATHPEADAIAVQGGKILAVGRREEIAALAGPGTAALDLAGKTVLPGFIDCHVHLTATGLDMLNLDLGRYGSLDELLHAVSENARSLEPGQWVMGRAYNEFVLTEKRPPTIGELDAAAPVNPVWIARVDGHSGLANTAGLKALGVPANVAGVERDGAGLPTGVLRSDANSFARLSLNRLVDWDTRKRALYAACRKMLSVGITSVHALEGGSLFSDEDVDVLDAELPRLPIGVKVFHQVTDVASVMARGYRQIGGCLLVDGSFGSRTAALLEPYADAPGESGELNFSDAELDAFVLEAHRQGLQITVHAIGDAAIEQILRAYEKALIAYPRPDHRHRIEHISLPTRDQIERCAAAGIVFSIMPAWAAPGPLVNEMAPQRLGSERVSRLYPIRSLIEAGGKLCAGSDSPISEAGPLLGLGGAATHFRERERISRREALSLYTTEAAWAGFEEGEKGRIAPGYAADLVVLGDDPFGVADGSIASLPVEMTMVRGRIEYRPGHSRE